MTHTPRILPIALLALSSLAPACIEPPFEPIGATVQAAGGTCSENICGSNSPSLGGHDASELHQAVSGPNLENQGGVRLVRFEDPSGVLARYQVTHLGELVIVDANGAVTHSGAQVVGSKFLLSHDASQTEYAMLIKDHRETLAYWVGASESLPSYTIMYSDDVVDLLDLRNLCPGPYPVDRTGLLYPHSKDVILGSGERYDIDKRDVFDTGAGADGWMNLACVGDGLSKNLMYRHRADSLPGSSDASTPDQRQALLRMWAADYCGTGMAFTEHGQPLTWRDRFDLMTEGVWTTVEAVWTPTGVACLNTPRLDTVYTRADILAACGWPANFPTCDQALFVDASWTGDTSHYFKTWNP